MRSYLQRRMGAIYRPGVLVEEIRNSVGGIVFTRTHFGPMIRRRVTPINPGSSGQAAVRSALSAATTAWRTLSDAVRDAWSAYSDALVFRNSLGARVRLLGLNGFVARNVPQQQAGLALRTAAPTVAGLSVAPGAVEGGAGVVVTAGGSQSISCTDIAVANPGFEADEDGAALLVYTSRGRSSSVNYQTGPERLAGVVLGSSGAPESDYDIPLAFAVTAGDIVRCRFVQISGAGQVGADSLLDATAA